MAVPTVSKLETEHTSPSTPEPEAGQHTVDVAGRPCPAKECIRRTRRQKSVPEKNHKSANDSDDSSSSDSDSSSDETSHHEDDTSTKIDSEQDVTRRQKKAKPTAKKPATKVRLKSKKSNKQKEESTLSESTDDAGDTDIGGEGKKQRIAAGFAKASEMRTLRSQLSAQGFDMAGQQNTKLLEFFLASLSNDNIRQKKGLNDMVNDNKPDKEELPAKKRIVTASKVKFKRLDEFWDEDLHDYKIKETSEDTKKDEFSEYIFTVRRKFDNDNHFVETLVDIKSDPLKECLQKVMGEVGSINLLEETPHIPPNMLFLYLDDLKKYRKTLKKVYKTANKHKARKTARLCAKHLETLITYLDEDFDAIQKTLGPLLKAGRITFELLWALYKPNTLAYTSTYGDENQPRAFKIDSVYQNRSVQRGTYYDIEGQFLDFDGKHFGLSDCITEVAAFRGTRKITSLSCYPLDFHRDADGMKATLLERGKKFLTLAGQNYKSCTGMAFLKKKDKVLKVNVHGRVMIDPLTFRRINPNYPLCYVEPRPNEIDDQVVCRCSSADDGQTQLEMQVEHVETFFRLVNGDDQTIQVVKVDAQEQAEFEQDIDSADKEQQLRHTFSDIELMIASPVIPGFSFGEKAWLEFAVSSVESVTWNADAFDALVLPDSHKTIVKALVSAHSLHASKTFDDIIAGKGKGLVAVLHGRPGLGKTLTCEAVSDLLKRPLYTISAGDLGTNPAQLEAELQSVLDVAHAWGAVILLDEADVFLEERSIHDVHRNALVSIFLRLLEYFQGIIFLTTNRVSTFDEAFVSRVHLSLRYGDLTSEAKKSVWKTFVGKARKADETELETISEKDFNQLARCEVNGRQIKNLVKTAHALALYEGKALCMEHIKHVMDVARSFEMELKGGAGYSDAMRSYT